LRRNTLVRLLLCAALSVTAAATAMVSTTPAQASTTCSTVSLKAANGLYVSAELGYTGDDYGMLRARAASVGPWEQFEECPLGPYTITLRSEANGLYVSAELGYTGTENGMQIYGMLRARATSVGPWEEFQTDNEALKAANYLYVTAELGYTGTYNGMALNGMLRARATSIGPWEQFLGQ